MLLKPTTYMNLSGKSVSALTQFYKLTPSDILVISDDIDMDFGKTRLRKQGSSGGQNGLKSIMETLGTDTIARLKIGIGRDARYSVSDWVLSRFKKEEMEALQADILRELEKSTKDWL
jgi:peptidyl-tRNA hydrolase, PTH1 family